MSRPKTEDSIERRLREQALRPEDSAFTRRVLAALPPRLQPIRWALQRSFMVTTRIGVGLALLVAAERGFRVLGGGSEALVVVLLALAPAVLAAHCLCGPLIPSSTLRYWWREVRHWR